MKSMLATLIFSMLLSISIATKGNTRYKIQISARQYRERVLKNAKRSSNQSSDSDYHAQMIKGAGTKGVDKTEDDDDDSVHTDNGMSGIGSKGSKGSKGSENESIKSRSKGNGAKGSDSGADDDDDDGMSGSSGKGLLSKKSKRGSSTKDNERLSYKGPKKGSTVAPTAPGSPDGGSPNSPSESPGNSGNTSNNPGTSNGSSKESVEVPTDTFQLDYTLSEDRAPTAEDFEQMVQLTSTYLEEYMGDVFGDGLNFFSTFMVFQEYQDDEPVRVDYRSVGTYAGDFDPIPTTADLNALITSAFSNPDLQGYLARFNSLPGSNVFQTISGVVQKAAAEAPGESSDTLETAIGAGAGALLLLAAAKYVSSRRKETNEAGSSEKLNGVGSDAGTIGEGDESSIGRGSQK